MPSNLQYMPYIQIIRAETKNEINNNINAKWKDGWRLKIGVKKKKKPRAKKSIERRMKMKEL